MTHDDSAATAMNEVITILTNMYKQQAETDRDGGREIAAWYYLDQLERATRAVLWVEDT